jgi:hypothetical protein
LVTTSPGWASRWPNAAAVLGRNGTSSPSRHNRPVAASNRNCEKNRDPPTAAPDPPGTEDSVAQAADTVHHEISENFQNF